MDMSYGCCYVFMQEGKTPLLIAASAGHLDVVKELMTHGANIEATDTVRNHST